MGSIKTKITVGIFVLVGFFIVSVAVVWLGMSDYFKKGLYYVAYFDESVQGLDKDSPVKYRGVPIGNVAEIGVAPDATLIEVVMRIEKCIKSKEQCKEVVAQLKSVGITGIMFVELNRKQPYEAELSPEIKFKPRYPVIDTKPSEIKKYMKSVDLILGRLQSLDLNGVVERAKKTLGSLNVMIEDLQIKDVSSEIRLSLNKFDQLLDSDKLHNIFGAIQKESISLQHLTDNSTRTVAHLNTILKENEKNISSAISGFKFSMDKAADFFSQGTDLADNTEKNITLLQNRLLGTLENLETISRNLNFLINRISAQPSQLFFSEPPSPRRIEEQKP